MAIHWYPAVDTNAIPLKEGRRVRLGDQEIALFNLGDEYAAIDNQCPHKQGPLADGIVAGKSVYCPLHTLNIDLTDGCALKGGEGQVKVYPTKVIEKMVYVAFDEGKFSSHSKSQDAAQNGG